MHTLFVLQSSMGDNYYVALIGIAIAVWGIFYATGPKLTREQKAAFRRDHEEWLAERK